MNGRFITYSKLPKKFFLLKQNRNVSSVLQGRLSIELRFFGRKAEMYRYVNAPPPLSADKRNSAPVDLPCSAGGDSIGFLVTTDSWSRRAGRSFGRVPTQTRCQQIWRNKTVTSGPNLFCTHLRILSDCFFMNAKQYHRTLLGEKFVVCPAGSRSRL